MMRLATPVRHFCKTATLALASSACLLSPSRGIAYQYIHPKTFSVEESPRILRQLGANESLLKVNRVASDKMTAILESSMVQGMAKGTLTKDEWSRKYMKADVLYIYKLGQELATRSEKEGEADKANVLDLAEMFLGYGKHFDRLKKYGLSEGDILVSPECDAHIALLSRETTMKEFYISVLTDMIPYVVFSNYLLHSIEPSDNNPWLEYAQKYGDLNNKYAKEKLGKTIRIANEILANDEVEAKVAESLFSEGFSFEEWFIRNAFSKGFIIKPVK